MVARLKDICSKLPKSYSNILLYNTLTGLRPDEACKSISLIHKEEHNYLKKCYDIRAFQISRNFHSKISIKTLFQAGLQE
jgi:hypothetical protein